MSNLKRIIYITDENKEKGYLFTVKKVFSVLGSKNVMPFEIENNDFTTDTKVPKQIIDFAERPPVRPNFIIGCTEIYLTRNFIIRAHSDLFKGFCYMRKTDFYKSVCFWKRLLSHTGTIPIENLLPSYIIQKSLTTIELAKKELEIDHEQEKV